MPIPLLPTSPPQEVYAKLRLASNLWLRASYDVLQRRASLSTSLEW